MASVWDDLSSWDEDDVDRYLRQASPIVTGAARAAAATTVGYLGLMVGTRPAIVDPLRFLDDIDLLSPFLGYWSALAKGAEWTEAVTLGRTRSETIATDTVNISARGTAREVDDAEPRITGWERVLSGNSCEFCATAATQRYRTAESASFGHDRCDCGVVPIVGRLDPGRVINRPLLDNLKQLGDESTGYVNASGSPIARPADAPVEAP